MAKGGSLLAVICSFLIIFFLGSLFLFLKGKEAEKRLKEGDYEKGMDALLKSRSMIDKKLLSPLEKKLRKMKIGDIEKFSLKEARAMLKYMLYLRRFRKKFRNEFLRVFANKGKKEEDAQLIELAAKVSSSEAYQKLFLNEAKEIKKMGGRKDEIEKKDKKQGRV